MPVERFLSGVAVVLGALITWEQALFLLRGWASRRWTRVPGRILESAPARSMTPSGVGRGQWYPNGVTLAFEYRVHDERYVGRLSTYRGYWPTLGTVVRRARQYPAGSDVSVWVDPDAPQRAVLEPGFGLMNVLGTMVGLGLLGLGVYTLRSVWGAA